MKEVAVIVVALMLCSFQAEAQGGEMSDVMNESLYELRISNNIICTHPSQALVWYMPVL